MWSCFCLLLVILLVEKQVEQEHRSRPELVILRCCIMLKKNKFDLSVTHLKCSITSNLFVLLFRSRNCSSSMNWVQGAASSCLKGPLSTTRWLSSSEWVRANRSTVDNCFDLALSFERKSRGLEAKSLLLQEHLKRVQWSNWAALIL